MIIETVKIQEHGCLVNGVLSVPNDSVNQDYQLILDWINEGNLPEGPDVIEPDYVALRTGPDGYASTGDQLGMQYDGTWEDHVAEVKAKFPKTITGGTTIGEVPQDILNAAAEKLFNTQADAYRAAKARLAQYQLSVGRPQVTEMQATGKQAMNEETHEMQDVLEEVVVQPAIEPLEATVEITVYNEDDPLAEPTKSVVTNPLIVKDDAQRTEAQEVIDSTPTQVKERVDNE